MLRWPIFFNSTLIYQQKQKLNDDVTKSADTGYSGSNTENS